MSKSFEWTLERANDPAISKLAGLDVSSAYELESEATFRHAFYMFRECVYPEFFKGSSIDSYWITNGEHDYSVRVSFDENADFDYFTFDREVGVGTSAFVQWLLEEIALKVIGLRTAHQPKIEKGLSTFKDIFWTVGNFVVVPEYDKALATKEKPWLRERVTVLLPLKMDVA